MLPNAQVPAFHAARLGPERWALRHEEDGVSWGELDRRSTRRAWALNAAGVVKDDLVTLSLPNGAAFMSSPSLSGNWALHLMSFPGACRRLN
jgi:bile acid-coenzyme A ligase